MPMSVTLDVDFKRWTAKHRSALGIEGWAQEVKCSPENALRANPFDIRKQYEAHLKDLQDAYGEAILELRARK